MRAFLGVAIVVAGCAAACAQTTPVPQKRPELTGTKEPDAALVRPQRREACPALLAGLIEGLPAAPFSEGECGNDSPLKVTSAGGVRFSAEATISCGMATALAALLPKVSALASETLSAGLVAIENGPGYECRYRNRAATGKISEHAFANALDISAFILADGQRIEVGAHWPHLAAPPAEGQKPVPPAERAMTSQSKFLVRAHDAACGLFSTVLGPDENAEHREHFHADLGCHGKDCRYLICN
jgi:hypothetical protein